jgi:hypothetical protein
MLFSKFNKVLYQLSYQRLIHANWHYYLFLLPKKAFLDSKLQKQLVYYDNEDDNEEEDDNDDDDNDVDGFVHLP